jgi:B12 binding domain
LARTYAAALVAGDEVAPEIAIREAFDANLSAAEIDDEIIAPALWLVGQLWERGEMSGGRRASRERDLAPCPGRVLSYGVGSRHDKCG